MSTDRDQQKRNQILGEDDNASGDLLPGEKSAYAYADSMKQYANTNRTTSKLEDQSERSRARAVLDRANQARMRETNSKHAAANKWSVMHDKEQARHDEESIYVVNRQLLDSKRVEARDRQQRSRCGWGCVVFSAVVVGCGTLWAVLERGGGGENSYRIPAAPLPPSWKLPFNPPTTSTLAAVEDVTSPQHAAYEWLLLDVIHNSTQHQPILHRLEQRFALATLYHATGGHQWHHQGGLNDGNNDFQAWMSEKDECAWWSDVGIEEGATSNTICDADGHLTRLVLSANNLAGSLPPQIGWLTALQQLDLTANALTGTLPWTLGKLTALQKLEVRHNRLQGSLPSELGQLKTTLQWLIVQENKLTGTFPSELWRLSELVILDVSENDKLEGSFPADLGSRSMPKIQEIKTSKNPLWTGSLPDSIGQSTALRELHLHHNQLSGSLPSTLPTTLVALKAPRNKFQGELPPWVLQPSLAYLDLGGNQGLTGTVPHTWAGYGNDTSTLRELKLWGTSLTGTVPAAFCPVFTLEFDCSKALCGCTCNCDDYAG